MGLFLSITTGMITAVFAGMVLDQFRLHPKPHTALWGFGLLAYSIGATAQAALFLGFNELLFALWYWSGAMMVAALLGQGTIFLLLKNRRIAWVSLWAVLALGAVGISVLMETGINSDAFRVGIDLTEQYKSVFSPTPEQQAIRTIIVILLNGYGSLALVGGAVYSAVTMRQGQGAAGQVIGNGLIAVGGLLPALSGTLILFGNGSLKYAGQLLGGILLFAGFLTIVWPRTATATHREPEPVEMQNGDSPQVFASLPADVNTSANSLSGKAKGYNRVEVDEEYYSNNKLKG